MTRSSAISPRDALRVLAAVASARTLVAGELGEVVSAPL